MLTLVVAEANGSSDMLFYFEKWLHVPLGTNYPLSFQFSDLWKP